MWFAALASFASFAFAFGGFGGIADGKGFGDYGGGEVVGAVVIFWLVGWYCLLWVGDLLGILLTALVFVRHGGGCICGLLWLMGYRCWLDGVETFFGFPFSGGRRILSPLIRMGF